MQKVKIEEIANELGIKPKDVLTKAVMMSIDVKSIKSAVSIEDATMIFDTIIHGKNIVKSSFKHTLLINKHNLKIYTTQQDSDIEFLKIVSKDIIANDINDALIFSYNYDDKILKDIYTNVDSEKLQKSVEKILENFSIEYVENDPLLNLKSHLKKHKPQLISIEGVCLQQLIENDYEVVRIIKNALLFGVRFNISLVEVFDSEREGLEHIKEMLTKKKI